MGELTDAELAKTITDALLRIINRIHMSRRIPRNYGAGGLLTLIEAELCMHVSRREGITGSEIAEELGVTPSAISQVIAKLKKKGCIRQEFGAGNAKSRQLFLTETGKAAADAVNVYSKLMTKELYGTSQRELRAYLRFVTKLEIFHDSIQKRLDDGVPDSV